MIFEFKRCSYITVLWRDIVKAIYTNTEMIKIANLHTSLKVQSIYFMVVPFITSWKILHSPHQASNFADPVISKIVCSIYSVF